MPSVVILVEQTMRRLREEGTTILLVYVMEKGEIRVTATPSTRGR